LAAATAEKTARFANMPLLEFGITEKQLRQLNQCPKTGIDFNLD
jgi:hypothetical protein